MTTGLGGKTMAWDAENRVRTATLGGAATSYAYGADGTRRKRSVGGATTLTIGPIEVRNYRGAGELLLRYPTPWHRLSGAVPAWFHRDQVGSIQLVSDAEGRQGRVTTYQPFGEARDALVSDPLAVDEAHGYVGERFDEAPELQFLNARYYDPRLSLFVSPDWLDVTIPGVGTNRYAYAGNCPVNNSDPGGNCPSCIGVVVGAVVGLATELASDAFDGGGRHSARDYVVAVIGGAAGGATLGLAAPAGIASGMAGGAFGPATQTIADRSARAGELASGDKVSLDINNV